MKLTEKELLEKFYFQMVLIRTFEERVQHLFLTEKMPGTIHSSIGQEAVAVGVINCLRSDDYLCGSHRGHGQYIIKGGAPREVMAELFGKTTGCSMGMGGSVHLSNAANNYLPGVGVVGAQIAIADGVGLSIQMRNTNQIVVSIFGDGATNTGYFHEAINLAAIWDLPVIFICENNFYAVSMPIKKTMRVGSIAERAKSYGIEGHIIDGNDVVEVWKMTQSCVEKARAGKGPTLLELQTYRHKGHSRFDPATYRPKNELESWLKKDPIPRLKKDLISKGYKKESDLDLLIKKAEKIVDEAVEFARSSPNPNPSNCQNFVFG